MPGPLAAAVIPAAVSAAAGIGSSLVGKHGQKNATKAQVSANDQALAYQREQDAKAEARQREIDAKAEAAWNAEQERLAPLRALKESLASATAGRMGLPFNTSGLSAPRAYPGAGGASETVSPLSSLSGFSPNVSRGTSAPISAALPDPATISEQDPYTTSAIRLADIARGGWRLR